MVCHCCHVLLVTQTTLGTMWEIPQGCEPGCRDHWGPLRRPDSIKIAAPVRVGDWDWRRGVKENEKRLIEYSMQSLLLDAGDIMVIRSSRGFCPLQSYRPVTERERFIKQ